MCKVKEFDQFFIQQYDYLKLFSKSINPQADYEGLLHDVYVKCKDRITIAGFTGQTFLNFTRVALMNTYKSNYRLRQKRQQIDICDENYYGFIEENLQQKLEQEEQDQELQNTISYVNTMVYSYIDKNYNEKDKFIFKTYFLLKPKKINYRQLSEATGFSITAVNNTIKRMKVDIRTNLEQYINGTIITGRTETIGV